MAQEPTRASPKKSQRVVPVWEDWFRLLVESAQDYAIFSTDPERIVNYWSTGATRLFQYTDAEILGESAEIIFTPEDRAAGIPVLETTKAAATGRASDERWHMRRDGTRFFASGLVFPLRSAEGTLIGFVKIARDLTERRLSDERLAAAHAELEERVKKRTAELDAANASLAATNRELRGEIEQRKRAEELRLEAVRRIVNLQEDERLKLSRDIHDQLGQHLAALMLGLTGLEKAGAELPAQVAQLKALTDRISREMHAIAVQLRPTSLEDLGLQQALASYTDRWSKQNSIKADFHATGMAGVRLSKDMDLALYRIVQEALTNVTRHAGASLVSVALSGRETEVVAIVEDNGKGFDAELEVGASVVRLGLLSMNERAVQFGGRVTVESSIGRGTTVFARIPFPTSTEKSP